jgi:hypothetical protein
MQKNQQTWDGFLGNEKVKKQLVSATMKRMMACFKREIQ